ncbi:hypothetical protein ATI02_1320 [Pseudomonas baetica]|uniref:Uncharacterized protein n=1 Tax=Pseudomonas baetica TaxID=674054 RepID=A0ABX4PU25_9PSED|nr:hypothetical protein [Pseudomonas baetica]PKA68537.1 hypothetical protein ATI02_1320 [Pseudomonas baetica]PTC17614.1 hypothetical protein C0J26_16110 [Pseudomonas baetica]
MSTNTLPTKGQVTAKLYNLEDFEAADHLSCKINSTHLYISATDKIGTDARGFLFNVALDKLPTSGEPATFALGSGNSEASANLIYHFLMLPAKEGSLTLRYFGAQQKVTGEFQFKADEKFIVSDGKLALEGVQEELINSAQTFTAELSGGITSSFEAETIYVTHSAQEGYISLIAYQTVETPSGFEQIQVNLFISDKLKSGTHTFDKTNTDVRAAYIWRSAAYLSQTGELVLLKDPSKDLIVAKLCFDALVLDAEHMKMGLKDGQINYCA